MRLRQSVFNGAVPKVAPTNLREGLAAYALDADLSTTTLRPFRDDRFLRATEPNTQAWVDDCCQVNIPCDASFAELRHGCDYIFTTGWDDTPSWATVAEWCEGVRHSLVIPCPRKAPLVDWEPVTFEDQKTQPGAFAFAWVNSANQEGPLSPGSPMTLVNAATGAVVSGWGAPPTGAAIERVRVYKLLPGLESMPGSTTGGEAMWHLMADEPAATASVTITATTFIGAPRHDMDIGPAPSNLRDIQSVNGTMLAGLSANSLRFSEPREWTNWPSKNALTFGDKPLRFVVADTFGYVLTCGKPSVVDVTQGCGQGGCRNVREVADDLPLAGLRAVAVHGSDCFYASREGIVMLRGATARVITEDLWTTEQWEALNPAVMRLAVHRGYLFGSTREHAFRLRVPTSTHGTADRTDFTELSLRADSFHTRRGELYYVAAAGGLYQWARGDSVKPYTYTSRTVHESARCGVGAVQVQFTDGPSPRVTLAVDNLTRYNGPVHPVAPLPMPIGIAGHRMNVTLHGVSEVTDLRVAPSTMDIARL
jgi:hypothetical protein